MLSNLAKESIYTAGCTLHGMFDIKLAILNDKLPAVGKSSVYPAELQQLPLRTRLLRKHNDQL